MITIPGMRRVSIHAPAGGATPRCSGLEKYGQFQSTHPQGVRRLQSLDLDLKHRFQSTHPQGVRQQKTEYLYRIFCFNPRTRRGCDRSLCWLVIWMRVSIHAPAGGATGVFCLNLNYPRTFQSTHPQGVRQAGPRAIAPGLPVSIHAPAGGATWGDVYCLKADVFQSTHPQGVRLLPCQPPCACIGVSIHAPAGGATCERRVNLTNFLVSIHAPAGGATSGAETHYG